MLNWHSKALLGPVNNFCRHQISDGSFEQMFGFNPGQLHRRRNARHEFDKLVIEQRHARFERNSHAHAIDFGKYVAGQISLAVDVEQGIERRAGRHVAAELAEVSADVA